MVPRITAPTRWQITGSQRKPPPRRQSPLRYPDVFTGCPYRKLHESRVVPGGGSAVGTKRSADLVLCDGERADQPNAGADLVRYSAFGMEIV